MKLLEAAAGIILLPSVSKALIVLFILWYLVGYKLHFSNLSTLIKTDMIRVHINLLQSVPVFQFQMNARSALWTSERMEQAYQENAHGGV